MSEKICEINLSVYGSSLLVSGSGKSFDHATREAVQNLVDTIAVNFRANAEPGKEVGSTVSI